MNPVIYAVVDPTATDPNLRMMPVSGTDNGDGTCSIDTTGGGGGDLPVITKCRICWASSLNCETDQLTISVANSSPLLPVDFRIHFPHSCADDVGGGLGEA